MEEPTGTTSGEAEVSAQENASPPPTDTNESLTAEQVEALWKNRVSQKDKAHAAETRALRERLDAFEKQAQERERKAQEQRLSQMTDAQRAAAEVEALRKQLEDERSARVIDTRKAKYPSITAELGDEVVAVMDEGRLAALEARFAAPAAPPPPTVFDPNSAPRTPTSGGSKEKTSEELKAELARMAPEFLTSLREN